MNILNPFISLIPHKCTFMDGSDAGIYADEGSGPTPVAHYFMLDDFELPDTFPDQATSTTGSAPGFDLGGPYSAAHVLGQYRGLYVHSPVGPGGAGQNSYISVGPNVAGQLVVSNDPDLHGTAEIIWCGDNNSFTVNPIGLYTTPVGGGADVGIDFLSAGATGIYVGFDPGNIESTETLTVDAWTDNSNYATLSLDISAAQTEFFEHYLLFEFTSFIVTGTMDWTNVGALRLTLTSTATGSYGIVNVIKLIAFDRFAAPTTKTSIATSDVMLPATGSDSDLSIPGGTRNYTIIFLGGLEELQAEIGEDCLIYKSYPGLINTHGVFMVEYGGPLHNGLGGLDVTAGGANTFCLVLEDATLQEISSFYVRCIDIFGGDASVARIIAHKVVLSDTTKCALYFPFSEYSGCDLTKLGGITLYFNNDDVFIPSKPYAKVYEFKYVTL